MRILGWLMVLFVATHVEVRAQEKAIYDLRKEVQRVCLQGDSVSAFHMAVKSLLETRRSYGNDDLRTAGCLITLADVAKYREKCHLAKFLYKRALSIHEKSLNLLNPDAVHCRKELSDLEQNH